ncbi:unnamed protein product [Polarella glacialis]|uniref:Uncharacterized protein n=1 Tax=Polarella glacialis TaxID=89957 RepID=A0A813DFH2_POLGL|nr:unnamed protein product [Polarella glacialis]
MLGLSRSRDSLKPRARYRAVSNGENQFSTRPTRARRRPGASEATFQLQLSLLDSQFCHGMYRLVFDADGNLGSTTSVYKDISVQCDQEAGCDPVRHPYPPFAFASFESRRYWYQYTSFVQFPHVASEQ